MPDPTCPPADVAAVLHPGLHAQVLGWYQLAARTLPWRAPGIGGWPVLVSEMMLQQTPVPRVLPAYEAWLQRWPTPAALAADPPGEAVRQWGRLGYPRRALRLHAAACAMVAGHGGQVPEDVEALRALPGVGGYTAAAVASFAFAQRHPVLDTNARRVLARLVNGRAGAPESLSAAETRLATALLPAEPPTAARWGVALMELGALVCRARVPRCTSCPVADRCAWRAAGYPDAGVPAGRRQTYAGTDRQARGALLAALRRAERPVPEGELAAAWAEPVQRQRALAGLLADGLAERRNGGGFTLPGVHPQERNR